MKKIFLVLFAVVAIALGGCPEKPDNDPRPPATKDQLPVNDPNSNIQQSPPG